MRITDLKVLLPFAFKAKLTPFIWGAHGVGKSAVIKQYAVENGYDFIDLRLGQLEVGDLLGLPEIVKGDKAEGKLVP